VTPWLRKAALTLHVACSVGWMGAVAAFLALALAGLGGDAETVRGAYVAMRPITSYVLVPLAVGTLVTGVVQSLGTSWGLFRYYWVVVKLVVTVFAVAVLLGELGTIGHAVDAAVEGPLARDDLRALRVTLVAHSGGGLLVLVLPLVLSIWKPPGRTRFGRD
jgi:hypothetical protein